MEKEQNINLIYYLILLSVPSLEQNVPRIELKASF